MATGIIGSGFGLYGYLPAVLQSEKLVFLTERVREKFSGRKELKQFASRVVWVADTEELLRNVETLIISTTPDVQEKIVSQSIVKDNIKNFILEKPLAISPKNADIIVDSLKKYDKNFRINYSFFYSDWFQNLEDIFSGENHKQNLELDIIWNFKAHHYANNLSNWKRFSSQGGGVINFFGIHLIAVIARLNFMQIVSSEVKGFNADDVFYFNVVANDKKTNVCNIRVNANSETNLFKIEVKNKDSLIEGNTLFESESPFEEKPKNKELNNLDIRVPLICRIANELREQKIDINLLSLYKNINGLWSELERRADASFADSI